MLEPQPLRHRPGPTRRSARYRMVILATSVVVAAIFPAVLAAQTSIAWGPELGYKAGGGPGVGAVISFDLGPALGATDGFLSRLETGGSFDLHFPEERSALGATATYSYWEMSGRLTVPFETNGTLTPYAGLGIGVGRISTDIESLAISTSDSEAGISLLGGGRFGEGSRRFFVELRLSSLEVARGNDRSSGVSFIGGVLLGAGS